MEGSLRLGGNIELFGVENIDHSSMIILKKIIGNYARKFSDKGGSSVTVRFGEGKVDVEINANDTTLSSTASHENVFFMVDDALKQIESKL